MTVFLWIYTGYKLFHRLANLRSNPPWWKVHFCCAKDCDSHAAKYTENGCMPRQRSLARLTNFPPKPTLLMSMMQNQSLYHAPIVWYKEYNIGHCQSHQVVKTARLIFNSEKNLN